MGMDVMGLEPSSERGEYFRNNVWYWRPLWDYCLTVAPELCADVEGHFNDGDGLDEEGALELAAILRRELKNGNTEKYKEAYYAELALIPRQDCDLCNATGIRSDEVGIEMGMPKKELSPEMQMLTGRTHGWCNACDGEGRRADFRTEYPFDVDNVREFAEFLAESGGFAIH